MDNNENTNLEASNAETPEIIESSQEEAGLAQSGRKIVDIVDEMQSSYLNYAMSVIVSRALPNAKDGLKPVQRRILYAMYKNGFMPNKPYKKSARTVGDVIDKYHPHGDTAVYDAIVRLAQDFSVRYTLVDGQGNFGSIDGDSPAAMRYTESRLQKISVKIIEEIDKNTVDFRANYDGSTSEPEVLPSQIPTLLLNGADGIAVGMATKIPPHNLGEISDAIVQLIEKPNDEELVNKNIPNYDEEVKRVEDIEKLPLNRFPKFKSEITIDEILKVVKGPDFPTGAEIYDQTEIKNAFATGRGRIVMRAVSEIQEAKGGKFKIVISELPYQVNKARLVAKIADLVKNKTIEGVSDIRDESNKDGIRVVVYLKRDSKPKAVLNRLYKYTEMQKAFNVNMLALVNNEPKVLNIKQALEIFIEHREEIVIREAEYNLAKSREREHILEGLIIALDNIDEIIETIRNSADSDTAKKNLIAKFKLSEIQAQAILDMQLRRLAALERQKIEDEYKAIKERILDLLNLLTTPKRILSVISEQTLEIKDKFADERRTKVFKNKVGEVNEEDLIAQEDVIVTVSEQGYIKRIKQDSYQVQRRGGVGKKFMTTKEDDAVSHVFSTNTHDSILFFTSKGRVFKIKVYDVPEYGRAAKGIPVINLINIDQNESVTSILTQGKKGFMLGEDVHQEGEEKTESDGKNYKYLFMATHKGVVKKTDISDFENIKSNGLIAIKLGKTDSLGWVKPTTGKNEVMLITKKGRSIKFNEKDVRPTGRATMGVTGIKFKTEDDFVISMDVMRNTEYVLLTVSENGYGKTTILEQFPIQKRGGQGVFAAQINAKTGDLVSARIIDHPEKELLIMSNLGQAVKIPTNELPARNRQTSGVRLIRLKAKSIVAAIAII